MKLYIALWFDVEDKIFRVAGVYSQERWAWKRIDKLGGSVQEVSLNKPVVFTHEADPLV